MWRGSECRKQALKIESGRREFQQKEQNPKGLAGSSQFWREHVDLIHGPPTPLAVVFIVVSHSFQTIKTLPISQVRRGPYRSIRVTGWQTITKRISCATTDSTGQKQTNSDDKRIIISMEHKGSLTFSQQMVSQTNAVHILSHYCLWLKLNLNWGLFHSNPNDLLRSCSPPHNVRIS